MRDRTGPRPQPPAGPDRLSGQEAAVGRRSQPDPADLRLLRPAAARRVRRALARARRGVGRVLARHIWPPMWPCLKQLAKHPKVIVSPYAGLDSPVVLVAWEHRLEVPSVNDPRVQQFIDAYAGGKQAPEPDQPLRRRGTAGVVSDMMEGRDHGRGSRCGRALSARPARCRRRSAVRPYVANEGRPVGAIARPTHRSRPRSSDLRAACRAARRVLDGVGTCRARRRHDRRARRDRPRARTSARAGIRARSVTGDFRSPSARRSTRSSRTASPTTDPLADGDIVNCDITIYLDGMHGDCSATFLDRRRGAGRAASWST